MIRYCPQHRVKEDAAGCALCRHEEALRESGPGWASYWNLKVLVPLLALGLAYAFWPTRRAATPPVVSTSAPAPAADEAAQLAAAREVPTDIPRYAETIEGLRLIVSHAQSNLGSWPDDPEEIDMSRDREWKTAKDTFKSDLERMRAGFPARIAHPAPPWRKAHDDLETAARLVERLLGPYLYSPSLTPHRSEIESRVERATAAIAAAEESLGRAKTTP